jgi:hypothetical protein
VEKMLSPAGMDKKRVAPSLWSVDSGYRSGSVFSNSLDDLILNQQVLITYCLPIGTETDGPKITSHPTLPNRHLHSPIEEHTEEPTIDPTFTDLNDLDTENTSFFLPKIERDGETCLQCEFWKITNPEENIKCEDCRIPEIVEPVLLVYTNGSSQYNDTVTYPRSSRKIRGTALNTDIASRCSACELSTLIDPSGPSSCQTCSSNPNLLSPRSPSSPNYKVRRSRAGRNSKLPLRALNQLQAWLDAHQDNPYPSAEVKRQLAQECGITEKQINTWMTNARARQLNPLDTYLSSSCSDDGAHESDIASAADTPIYATGFSYLSENHAPARRAGSVSGSSAFSAGNTRPQPSRRGKKKNYRRNNQASISELNSPTSTVSPVTPVRGNATHSEQEMWQCTFCHTHLVPKSWRRHEETQHRPKAEWTCMLYGPRLSFPSRSNSNTHTSNSSSCCAFCMLPNPPSSHYSTHHRITECSIRPLSERTFYRPDHLRQHVKNFHNAALFESVQSRWKRKAEEKDKGYTCGFCGVWLESWDKREGHIAGHFKEGATMEGWVDPEVWEMRKKGGDGGVEMDVDVRMDTCKGKGKGKGKMQKEKAIKEQEKDNTHMSGLARLSRTFSFSRRSTRKIETPHHAHTLPPTSFANSFAPIPVSMPANIPFSYPLQNTYSTTPVLPNINIDPLMPMDVDLGYGNIMDWPQYSTGDVGLAMTMTEDVNTQFGTAYDPDLDRALAEYGNTIGNPGCGNGWGQG